MTHCRKCKGTLWFFSSEQYGFSNGGFGAVSASEFPTGFDDNISTGVEEDFDFEVLDLRIYGSVWWQFLQCFSVSCCLAAAYVAEHTSLHEHRTSEAHH